MGMQRRAESRHSPLALCEARNAKNWSVTRETKTADGSGEDSLGKGPAHSWHMDYIRSVPVVPGDYKWVSIGTDTYCRLGFAYLVSVVNANAQNVIKGSVQRILPQLGSLSYISSDQGTHFTAHSVQQWAKWHDSE